MIAWLVRIKRHTSPEQTLTNILFVNKIIYNTSVPVVLRILKKKVCLKQTTRGRKAASFTALLKGRSLDSHNCITICGLWNIEDYQIQDNIVLTAKNHNRFQIKFMSQKNQNQKAFIQNRLLNLPNSMKHIRGSNDSYDQWKKNQ